jgi:hypothetical protein
VLARVAGEACLAGGSFVAHAPARRCAAGRLEGAAGRLEGAAGRLDGAAGRLEGAAGRLEGAAGRLEGAAGRLEGAAGRLEGAAGRLMIAPTCIFAPALRCYLGLCSRAQDDDVVGALIAKSSKR